MLKLLFYFVQKALLEKLGRFCSHEMHAETLWIGFFHCNMDTARDYSCLVIARPSPHKFWRDSLSPAVRRVSQSAKSTE